MLFNFAIIASPTGSIHYVIANAGITPRDDVSKQHSKLLLWKKFEPLEPSLNTINVNLKVVLYTAKRSMDYFIKQNSNSPSSTAEDTLLILIGSGGCNSRRMYSFSTFRLLIVFQIPREVLSTRPLSLPSAGYAQRTTTPAVST